MAKAITRDLTSGSTTKLILKFSLPMLIGNLFQQLYNMVDSIVVGNFVSKDALAAIGATGSLIFLIFGLTFGLSAGISIVISQYFGAKDYDNIRKSFATATYIVIGASIIMGTIGFFSSRWLLELLGTPSEIIGMSNLYMKISYAGILGIACYNGMAAVLRALGDSITPLIFLVIASLLNVVLDLVFVIKFGWGIPGVAIATIISQVISAVGCIVYAMAKIKILRMPLKEFKPDRVIFKKCIHLGVPVALQNSFVSISMMAMQGVINDFSSTVMAAATVVNRIEQLVLQPSMSLGAAVAAFTGQNIGAGHIDRAKKGMKSATIIILIFSLVMLPVMYFGGEYIMKLFTKKEDIDVVLYGVEGIRITSFFYSAVGMIFITRNFLSGSGDIHVPMIMGFTEVVFRVLFSRILSVEIGFHGIFWATSITWFATGILGVLRVMSGKWKNKSIIK
ncbi:MAG TPA: MATE family efflux transporter [Mobilitalea sp.]|nr:MATE family efflux transporter [Mobilitalea sp.]